VVKFGKKGNDWTIIITCFYLRFIYLFPALIQTKIKVSQTITKFGSKNRAINSRFTELISLCISQWPPLFFFKTNSSSPCIPAWPPLTFHTNQATYV
jgi:hypothetical protein